MDFITKLGFLGLLGILILIMIYLIKPNYQQKLIASTYVWKQSLKYRRKRLPINKFRNILILICQILAITMGAFLLAQPFIAEAQQERLKEKIIIIDASASMQAIQENGYTRFSNATSMIEELSEKTILEGGRITLIYAGKTAQPLIVASTVFLDVKQALDDISCTFVSGDIDGAIVLCEDFLKENPVADVLLYTATVYENVGNMEVVNISESEWNAALLSARADVVENYYVITVEAASYNNEKNLDIYLDIYGANGDTGELPITIQKPAFCRENDTERVVFSASDDMNIYSYNYIHVYLKEADSFGFDNHLYIYGGIKPVIKVLYTTTTLSPFYTGVMYTIQDMMKDRWDIELDVTTLDEASELKGYDFYIFEYQMPHALPTDGVVLLANPDVMPDELGIVLGEKVNEVDNLAINPDLLRLSKGESSQVMSYVTPENMIVTEYTRVESYHYDFKPLMYFAEDPVFFVKNTADSKVAIHTFSFRYSNLSIVMDFPILIANLFDIFLPATLSKTMYDVDELVQFNETEAVLREGGVTIKFEGNGKTVTYDNRTDYSMSGDAMGTYVLTQSLLSPIRDIELKFYVKVSAVESDFTKSIRVNPPFVPKPKSLDLLLFFYFSAAFVAFLFVEKTLGIRGEI